MIDIEKAIIEGSQVRSKYTSQFIIRAFVISLIIIPLMIVSQFLLLNFLRYLFNIDKNNPFITPFIFLWVGLAFGVIMYLGIKNILHIIDYQKLLPLNKNPKIILLAPYGLLTLLFDIFGLLSSLNPKSTFVGYQQLSKFYIVDQNINPIAALKKARNAMSEQEARKLKFLDNYAFAHVYRQLNPIEK